MCVHRFERVSSVGMRSKFVRCLQKWTVPLYITGGLAQCAQCLHMTMCVPNLRVQPYDCTSPILFELKFPVAKVTKTATINEHFGLVSSAFFCSGACQLIPSIRAAMHLCRFAAAGNDFLRRFVCSLRHCK